MGVKDLARSAIRNTPVPKPYDPNKEIKNLVDATAAMEHNAANANWEKCKFKKENNGRPDAPLCTKYFSHCAKKKCTPKNMHM